MDGVTQCSRQSGSALVIVLLVMTLIFAGALSLRRTTLFQADMALARVRTEQQRYLTEGVLAYGLLIAHKNVEELMTFPDRTEIIEAGAWPLGHDLRHYTGKVCFITHKAGVRVIAQLYEGLSLVKQLQCELTKESEGKRIFLSLYADTAFSR